MLCIVYGQYLQTMPTIYVLRCEGGCYFIGKTQKEYFTDVDKHFQGTSLEWTQVHKPIRLHLLRFFCDDEDVHLYTTAYMQRYGVDKVRGGKYSECVLSSHQLDELNMLMNINNNNHHHLSACIKCGFVGHTKTKCPFPHTPIETERHTFTIEPTNQPVPPNRQSCSSLKALFCCIHRFILSLVHQRSRSANTDLFQSLYDSNV